MRLPKLIFSWFLPALFLLAAAGARAAEFCATDAATLQDHLTTAQSNGVDDTIKIVSGTYKGNFVFSSAQANYLIIEGGYDGCAGSQTVNPSLTVLDGQRSGSVLSVTSTQAMAFTLKNLTLTAGSTTASAGGGLMRKCTAGSAAGSATLDGVVIRDNYAKNQGGGAYFSKLATITITNGIVENNSSSNYGGGFYLTENSTTTIRGTVIRNNRTNYPGGGLFLMGGTLLTMEDSTVAGNSAEVQGGCGMMLTEARFVNNVIHDNSGEGMWFSGGTKITMINNTITNNGWGAYINIGEDAGFAKLYNNIIRGNTATEKADMWLVSDQDLNGVYATVELKNNDFDKEATGFSIDKPSFVIDASNIDADPTFMDAAAGNYRLGSTSPCLDTGNNTPPIAVNDDRDSGHVAVRPVNVTVDMGAYERPSSLPSAPDTPGSVAASVGAEKQVIVTWGAVAGADGYLIYRSDTVDGTYSQVGTVTAVETSYADLVACGASTAYFKVAAFNYGGTSGQSAWAAGSPDSCPVMNRLPVSLSPTCIPGTNAPGGSFEVWNSGGGTLKYTITDNAGWLSCSPTPGTSRDGEHKTVNVQYTTAALGCGTYYANITVAGEGLPSQTVPVTLVVTEPAPDTPGSVSATDGTDENQVVVSWGALADADGYLIYRSDTIDGTYTEVGTAAAGETSFTQAAACGAAAAYYKVAAYNCGGTSGWSAPDAGSPAPCTALGRSPTSLSPTCVLGADAAGGSFEVWNNGGGTLDYTITDDADWLSCSPAAGSSGGEHDTIAVQYATAGLAVGEYGATITISSDGLSPLTISVSLQVTEAAAEPPPVPTGLAATQKVYFDKIALSWGAASGADGYKLYRSATATGAYTLIQDIAGGGTTLFEDPVACGPRTFYYKLSAYNTGGDSAQSGSVTGITKNCQMFLDNFNDFTITDKWTILPGSRWTIPRTSYPALNSDRYYFSRAVCSLAAQPSERIDADIYLSSSYVTAANAHILFAYKDQYNYRYLVVQRGALVLGQRGTLGASAAFNKVFTKSSLVVNRWYHVRLDVFADGRVKAYVSNEAAPSATWTYAAPYTGRIGVAAKQARSMFDNFVVKHGSLLPP